MQHVKEVENNIKNLKNIQQRTPLPDQATFLKLAENLFTIWNSPSTDMHLKQKILRLLICEIITKIDKQKSEIIMVIHWKGGRHSELKIHKNKTGHHSRSNSMEAVEIIKQMAVGFSDKVIASTLNRLLLKTGIGNSWTESRVRSVRNYHNTQIKENTNFTLTLENAAKELNISPSTLRRLIKHKIITAQQIVKCAPWQIEKSELEKEPVQRIIKTIQSGRKFSRSLLTNGENPMLFNL